MNNILPLPVPLPLLNNLESLEEYRLLKKPYLTNAIVVHRTINETLLNKINSYIASITTINEYLNYIFRQNINLKFLRTLLIKNNLGDLIINSLFNRSIITGKLDFCSFLYNTYNQFILRNNITFCNLAAEYNQLEILQWLHENDFSWDEITSSSCAFLGDNIDCLQYIRSVNPPCPWDEDTCITASSNGHILCLQFAHENGCPWNEEVCAIASENNHLNILQYLRSVNPPCPWDEEVCANASYHGYLNILQWCRNQNPPCPWDGETCNFAIEGGNLECLRFAIENNCEYILATLFETLNTTVDIEANIRQDILNYLNTLPPDIDDEDDEDDEDNMQIGGNDILNENLINLENILLLGIILVCSTV